MIKKLIKYVGEYKKPTILTPIFVLLESVMEILIPLLMAKLIDDGIDMGDMNVIVKYGLILLAAALLTMFFGSAAGITVDLSKIESAATSHFIICEGQSTTQVMAIADSIREYVLQNTGILIRKHR